MTATDTKPDVAVDAAPAAAPISPLMGNPGTIGLPTAIAGATGLVIVNAGWLPTGSASATLAILMGCTVIGLLSATVWAAALAQNVSASIFGAFCGFYASYTAMVIGLGHNWFGPTPLGDTAAVRTWLICWIVTFTVMTLVTLRLPFANTFILAAVVVALVLLLAGTIAESSGLIKAGAAAVFVFDATAVYLYADAMIRETGGRGLPMGRPIQHA